MKKINKKFVSEIDKILYKYDAEHPKSPSQQCEIDKYKLIFELRDKAEANVSAKSIQSYRNPEDESEL